MDDDQEIRRIANRLLEVIEKGEADYQKEIQAERDEEQQRATAKRNQQLRLRQLLGGFTLVSGLLIIYLYYTIHANDPEETSLLVVILTFVYLGSTLIAKIEMLAKKNFFPLFQILSGMCYLSCAGVGEYKQITGEGNLVTLAGKPWAYTLSYTLLLFWIAWNSSYDMFDGICWFQDRKKPTGFY
jgi:uncharacterized membrane protein